MPLNLYYDKDNIVKIASKDQIISKQYQSIIYTSDTTNPKELIGKRILFGKTEGVRLALICNWNDQCGISTYTQYLINALAPKLDALKIFSENRGNPENTDTSEPQFDVEYNWKRGQSLLDMTQKIIDWKPNIVLIQHEFGIFPKASYFMSMMENLKAADIAVAVTLHSVYEHKDKSVCSAVMDNIIVHSNNGKHCLRNTLQHTRQNIFVIPHGCVDFGEIKPNYNQFGVSYPIVQFGFAFSYKGVDVALDAIHLLKKRNSKFNNIFYCYLCSESSHAKNTHYKYYREIRDKVDQLNLKDNVSIQRGFFSDNELNQFLRTARLCIFPYQTDPNNIVYGASGAIRIAMANGNPVIASHSHMFDDLEGVLPRPGNAGELANEIAKVFNDGKYKQGLLDKQRKYIIENSWEVTADRYLKVLKEIIDNNDKDVIIVTQQEGGIWKTDGGLKVIPDGT